MIICLRVLLSAITCYMYFDNLFIRRVNAVLFTFKCLFLSAPYWKCTQHYMQNFSP